MIDAIEGPGGGGTPPRLDKLHVEEDCTANDTGNLAGLGLKASALPTAADGKIDFARVAADALQRVDAVLNRWLPDGKRQGAEWVARNPTRSDSTPGSFKVNRNSGEWADFATGDKGRDLVSLVKYLDGAADMPTAARELAALCGSPAAGPARARPSKPRPADTAVAPVPADAPPPPDRHPKHGEPAAVWNYRDASGALLFRVARFDPPEGRKEILPQSLHREPEGLRWRWKGLPTPRPLYGLDRLAAAPDLPVLIVEGEKSADSAGRLLPGWVAMTSPNGSNSAGAADWAPLKGRRCVIWKDHDDPGGTYAADVRKLATKAGAAAVAIVDLEGLAAIRNPILPLLPAGFDAADAEAEGLVADAIDAWLTEALRIAEAEPPDDGDTGEDGDADTGADDLPDDGRPRIPIRNGEMHLIVDALESALIGAGVPVYARGETLVRAVPAPADPGAVRRVEGSLILVPVTVSSLIDDGERHASFVKFSKTEEGKLTPRKVSAPPMACRTLLERVGRWRFPQLRGLAAAPFVRADGSICTRSGYDAASGLLLAIPPDWPEPIAAPTRADALAALARLRHLIHTFPWSTPADESVALAALLTPFVRPGVEAAPMIGFSATAAGSGKSMLADLVAILATGRPAAAMSWGRDDAENEKRLTGALLAGDAVVTLDNIEVPLRGELLCTALTQSSVKLRPLGQTPQITVPSSALILGTGNGLTLAGDTTRRALVCQLDAGCERPELREFSNNPKHDALAGRTDLVNDALTIVRAGMAADFRRPSPLGSFEAWSRRVRDALIWLGMPDPVGVMERSRAADPEREAGVAIVHAWHERFGSAAKTAADVLAAATGDHAGGLGDALALLGGPAGVPTAKSLGRWLRTHQGRVLDGLVLRESGGVNVKNGRRYRVDVHGDKREPTEAGGVSGLYGVSPSHYKGKNQDASVVHTETRTTHAGKKHVGGLEETPQSSRTPPAESESWVDWTAEAAP